MRRMDVSQGEARTADRHHFCRSACAALSALIIGLASTGCADATTSPGPAAPHRGGWQQFCEQAWNMQQASALVAARGAEGWELVSMYNGGLCYKRPGNDPIVARPAGPAPRPVSGAGNVPSQRDPGF